MNEHVTIAAHAQTDHHQWDFEHTHWRADIENWQREHESSLLELTKLQEFIRRHGEALASHAAALEQHDQRLRDHHRAMSELETRGGGEPMQATLAEEHRDCADRQQIQRQAHERIAKHHHTVMAHLKMLEVAIEAAM